MTTEDSPEKPEDLSVKPEDLPEKSEDLIVNPTPASSGEDKNSKLDSTVKSVPKDPKSTVNDLVNEEHETKSKKNYNKEHNPEDKVSAEKDNEEVRQIESKEDKTAKVIEKVKSVETPIDEKTTKEKKDEAQLKSAVLGDANNLKKDVVQQENLKSADLINKAESSEVHHSIDTSKNSTPDTNEIDSSKTLNKAPEKYLKSKESSKNLKKVTNNSDKSELTSKGLNSEIVLTDEEKHDATSGLKEELEVKAKSPDLNIPATKKNENLSMKKKDSANQELVVKNDIKSTVLLKEIVSQPNDKPSIANEIPTNTPTTDQKINIAKVTKEAVNNEPKKIEIIKQAEKKTEPSKLEIKTQETNIVKSSRSKVPEPKPADPAVNNLSSAKPEAIAADPRVKVQSNTNSLSSVSNSSAKMKKDDDEPCIDPEVEERTACKDGFYENNFNCPGGTRFSKCTGDCLKICEASIVRPHRFMK